MTTTARFGLIAVLLCCPIAILSPAAYALTISPSAAGSTAGPALKAPPPKVEAKVVSCAAKITVQAKLSESYLKGSIDNSAKVVNFNDVVLSIYNSTAGASVDIDCYYKSANGDIPNIVYRIPCKRPKKGATSYEHSYWCMKN